MLLLGHWPALVGADARLFELRPVAGIDGGSLMGHRVGSCAFSPITLVDSAIPIISVLDVAEHLLGRPVVEAVSLARCAQRGSRSHGRRRFRFCARRTSYAACARQTGFIACDGPSVIGYWLALVMAGANNRAFWPSGDKMNDYSHVQGLVKTVWDSKLQTIVKNVQFPDAQRWFEGFLDPLIANNRSLCPRASKTHDFSRSTIAKAGASECPRGQNQRLFADSFDFACTWGAQVLLKRWLVRC